MKVYARNIYRMNEPYDEEHPEYDCMHPAETGSCGVFDAWICDAQGRIHPGYALSPVPIQQNDFNPTPLSDEEI